MYKTGRERAASRAGRAVLSLLVGLPVLFSASSALAVTMSISPRQGPPGTTVNVSLSALSEPCRVFFDNAEVVGSSDCQPGPGGAVSASFRVPSAAGTGDRQVLVLSGSSSVGITFRVTSTAAPPAPAPAPPAPAPAPPAPAPAPPAPAPAPPAPAPAPPAPAPAPPAPPALDQEPTDETPIPEDATCDLQPSAVESLRVTPDFGPAGSSATVLVTWAPTAGEGCPDARAQITINGIDEGEPIAVGGEQARLEVQMAEDLPEGDITVSLIAATGVSRSLATTAFTVEGADSESGLSPILVAATVLTAVVAIVAIQQIYSRRKAMYGRQ